MVRLSNACFDARLCRIGLLYCSLNFLKEYEVPASFQGGLSVNNHSHDKLVLGIVVILLLGILPGCDEISVCYLVLLITFPDGNLLVADFPVYPPLYWFTFGV